MINSGSLSFNSFTKSDRKNRLILSTWFNTNNGVNSVVKNELRSASKKLAISIDQITSFFQADPANRTRTQY